MVTLFSCCFQAVSPCNLRSELTPRLSVLHDVHLPEIVTSPILVNCRFICLDNCILSSICPLEDSFSWHVWMQETIRRQERTEAHHTHANSSRLQTNTCTAHGVILLWMFTYFWSYLQTGEYFPMFPLNESPALRFKEDETDAGLLKLHVGQAKVCNKKRYDSKDLKPGTNHVLSQFATFHKIF